MSHETGMICKAINWLARRCAGAQHPRIEPETPLPLREASHRFANEMQILKHNIRGFEKSADELQDLLRKHGA